MLCLIAAGVPFNRWDIDSTVSNASTLSARFGGFVADIASFDAQLFGIKSAESILMDPQQRLLLMHTYQVGDITVIS